MPAQPSTIASAPSSSSARGDLITDARARVGRRIVQGEHRNVGGAHTSASAVEAIAAEVVLDHRDRARERGDDGEAMASRLAMWNAASPMPTTGALASARAASRPVSSKQAMTCHRRTQPRPRRPAPAGRAQRTRHRRSPRSRPARTPSSTARMRVPAGPPCGRRRDRPVIAAVVLGLTMLRCTMALYSSHARGASEPSSRCPARRQLSPFKRRLRRSEFRMPTACCGCQ